MGPAAQVAQHQQHWQKAAASVALLWQVVGLILLAALQRRRRGIHISTMLRPDQVPTGATLRELRAARGTSLDLTSHLEVRHVRFNLPWPWRQGTRCAPVTLICPTMPASSREAVQFSLAT